MENKQTMELAGLLYKTYCDAVGGKAFNGDPLPDWKTFSQDPAKSKQAFGWYEVARAAQSLLQGV